MSAYVDFFAFRANPDLAALSSVRGLKAFRLFKHNANSEWYLEDAGSKNEITFSAPLRYSPSGDASKRAQAGAKAFYDVVKRDRLEPWGLDTKRVIQGLALSCELNLPTLAIYGNTGAGVDVGLICEAGKVTYARLKALPTGVLVFDSNAASVETAQSEEFDEDGEPVLDQFQFGTEVANRFFSDTKRWRVTPEVDASAYTLLLERR